MKLKMTLAALAIASATATASASASASDSIETRTLHVERIVSGTTLATRDMETNSTVHIRLAMVQAPSRRYHPAISPETDLSNLIGRSGPITAHIFERGIGGIFYAFVENNKGEIINAEMVRSGSLVATGDFSGNQELSPFFYAIRHAHIEAYAEEAGVWSSPHADSIALTSMQNGME